MSYELWSLTSRNLMYSFESEVEAVETARLHLDAGDHNSAQLAIVIYDDEDVPVRSVTGPALAALVDSQRDDLGRRTA